MVVDHYGLHQDGGITFLIEDGGTRCLTPGLESLESPFRLELERRLPCPHKLTLQGEADLPDHPLVDALAPKPQQGAAFYLPASASSCLLDMQSMVGGGQRRVFFPWALRRPMEKLVPQLTLTNCAAMMILGYEPKDYLLLERLLLLPRTRNLILCGPLRLPDAEELPIMTNYDDYDWPRIGATMTRDFVNGLSP